MTVQPNTLGMKLGNTAGQVTNTMAPMPAVTGGATTLPMIGNNPVAANDGAYVPPTGLIGSEAALLGGLTGGMQSLNSGAQSAQNTLNTAIGGVGGVQSFGSGSGEINNAISSGVSALNPYNAAGKRANDLASDLSGANGPEAQQAAWDAYQSSPAMKYQMDQMMEATQQSAAARGGLLGGNVLQELQRNASGIASQDYQNQFANISSVADRGLGAASQIGNLRSNQASLSAQLQQADIASKTSQANNQAQIKASLAQDLANTAYSAGIQGAGMLTQTGGLLAQGRTNAGNAIAQNATQAAASISNLMNQQGIVVSDMVAKDISTITDMIYQSGLQDSMSSQNLAAILANIAGGQGSTVAQGNAAIGAANAAGTIGIGNAIQGGIQQGIANYQKPQQAPVSSGYNQPVATINTGAQYGGYA